MPTEGVFTKADVLVQLAKDFFEWCDRTPRYKTEVIKHKMEWDTVEIELQRPYTLSGLCVSIGVSQSYFRQYKTDLREKLEAGTLSHDDARVLSAIEWIEQIVYTDQIEGAATGQYNANIIARLNGMADNINSTAAADPVLRITTRDAETTANLNTLIATL